METELRKDFKPTCRTCRWVHCQLAIGTVLSRAISEHRDRSPVCERGPDRFPRTIVTFIVVVGHASAEDGNLPWSCGVHAPIATADNPRPLQVQAQSHGGCRIRTGDSRRSSRRLATGFAS